MIRRIAPADDGGPSHQPHEQQPSRFAQDHPDQRAVARAERLADADLVRPPGDAVRQHAVEPDGRKQQRDDAERDRQLREQPVLHDPCVHRLGQRTRARDRHVGLGLLHDAPHVSQHRRSVSPRPHDERHGADARRGLRRGRVEAVLDLAAEPVLP